MITKERFRELLINDGWHIGDGVDDCAGEDKEAMEESISKIFGEAKANEV